MTTVDAPVFQLHRVEVRPRTINVYTADPRNDRYNMAIHRRELAAPCLAELGDAGTGVLYASAKIRPRVHAADYAKLRAIFATADVRNIPRDVLLVGTPIVAWVRVYEWQGFDSSRTTMIDPNRRRGRGLGLEAITVDLPTLATKVMQ